jgi:hypothetical protein
MKTRYLLTKWKLCEQKTHSGAAKPRNSTIQKQSRLQRTRTHKTYCSSHTFNYNTKPIMNASQPNLLLERVFDGFLYTDGHPKGIAMSSGRMLLTYERPNALLSRLNGSLGSDFSE